MGNHAQVFLDDLRRMVAARYPGVRVVQAPSAYDDGEDRYEAAPGVSLYVQAPVTRIGEPRRRRPGCWRWSRYVKPPQWVYSHDAAEVYLAISELAEKNGHRSEA